MKAIRSRLRLSANKIPDK